jgi:hypothetical protein
MALLCRWTAEKIGKARPEKAQQPEQNLPVLRFRLERIVARKTLVDDRESAVRLSRIRVDCVQQFIFEFLSGESRWRVKHLALAFLVVSVLVPIVHCVSYSVAGDRLTRTARCDSGVVDWNRFRSFRCGRVRSGYGGPVRNAGSGAKESSSCFAGKTNARAARALGAHGRPHRSDQRTRSSSFRARQRTMRHGPRSGWTLGQHERRTTADALCTSAVGL